jgi:hypothetical protein
MIWISASCLDVPCIDMDTSYSASHFAAFSVPPGKCWDRPTASSVYIYPFQFITRSILPLDTNATGKVLVYKLGTNQYALNLTSKNCVLCSLCSTNSNTAAFF